MKNEMSFSTYHEIIAGELCCALKRYFEQWDDILDMPEEERPFYDTTIERHRISVVVLCAVLAEYSINFYLSAKCDAATFKELERKNLFEKWAKLPKQFLPAYKLPPKSQLAKDLSNLVNRRNVLAHPKPAMSIDGDDRHPGNHPPVALDENDFICRCASLPFRLVDNLLKFDQKGFTELHILRDPCAMVANECSFWEEMRKREASYQKELIHEIMEQGYSRHVANLCAIQFRYHPPVLEKVECLVVKDPLGKDLAKLRPLKFYNMA
jgi:hypothetical protein